MLRTLRFARILPLAALGACAGSIGLEEEARIGDSYAAEITAQTPLIRDPAAVQALNRLGGELAQRADSTGRRYTFYLVDSPEVNAFAIPGGHVFVNRGLVEA
ncbi:MAG TPA: M48 family metalloprotease, partial [Longimicrobium sp.]|nr:M48 family metalloprotease [Longimicrobium sp.]